jgi:hypothetical protein
MAPPSGGENIGVAFLKIYATIPSGKTDVCELHTNIMIITQNQGGPL